MFKQPSLSKARWQITIFFIVATATLLLSSTLVMSILIRWQLQSQAEQSLQKALGSVSQEYQTQQLSGRVGTIFQMDNSLSPAYQETGRLPNVADKKKMVSEKSTQAAPAVADQLAAGDQEIISNLQANKAVYSRVISANGDIVITSDLFEALSIDHGVSGFVTREFGSVCVHALTSQPDKNGTVIQVGQYCALSWSQQVLLFVYMSGVTFLAVGVTSVLGWWVAGYFLYPLSESLRRTREFAQNCYHELLTPLSVALSSAQAALLHKKYQKGLQEVTDELIDMRQSLQVLSDGALAHRDEIAFEKTSLDGLVKKMVGLHSSKSKLQWELELQKVSIESIPGSFELILNNLLTNAEKYSKAGTRVLVQLNLHKFLITTHFSLDHSVDPKKVFQRGYRGTHAGTLSTGAGVGLAVVKELAQANGWTVSAQSVKNSFTLEIDFSK